MLTWSNALAVGIVGAYLLATLAIGLLARRSTRTSSQFLHARRALPTAVTAAAFLAANCGALEIVGITATSAKYGALALHFYWVGAIPAMLFLALFMMPVYARSGAMTVPDFLRVRYGAPTQILSAISLAVMMIFVAGISLYAISTVLNSFFAWGFLRITIVSSAVILCYSLAGGLRATIYNEILQFGLTIASLIPVTYFVLREFHGIHPMLERMPYSIAHTWVSLPFMQPRSATMDVFGLVFGLGLVLSCGYWCTDFILIQRALAARDLQSSVNTPLFAAIAKLFFPLLVVIPGVAAGVFFRAHGITRYDQALSSLMRHYYGSGLLGLGISGVLASLMSGLAGNISAFSAVWTHDLYRTYIRPARNDAHYLRVGRISAALACLLSIFAAYLAFRYNDLMDYLQLLFSLFNAPLFAVFLMGMFTTWATPTAGFTGLLCGVIVAAIHNFAVRFGALPYGSQMLANFYGAIYGWVTCVFVVTIVSRFTTPKPADQMQGITYFTQEHNVRLPAASLWLAAAIAATCIALNLLFR